MLFVEIHAETAATHHAVPTGAGESAPDVRQGALGGRRVRFGVIYVFVLCFSTECLERGDGTRRASFLGRV